MLTIGCHLSSCIDVWVQVPSSAVLNPVSERMQGFLSYRTDL